MKRIKKIISPILIAVIFTSLLSGCNSDKDYADDITLTYWTGGSGTTYVSSYNELIAYDKIQQELGVKLEFIHPSTTSWIEQFDIMLASGEYADIINQNNWDTAYHGGLSQALKDGIIIDLTEYYESGKMPYYKGLLTKKAEIEMNARTLEGKILSMGTVKSDEEMGAACGPIVRKDWMDKLGLSIPDTMDDWYDMLTAFKTKDPNGNGQADEIPFGETGSKMFKHFAGAYGVISREFYKNDDGVITYGSIEPGYKEFIAEMNRWYSQGLIDAEYVSSTKATMDANVTNNLVGSFVGLLSTSLGNYLKIKEGAEFNLIGVKWPKKEADSVRYNPITINDIGIEASGAAVSTSCKNPDLAVTVLDYMYSEKATEYLNWGIEGETYTKENGEYKFTDYIMNNPDGLSPSAAIGKYTFPALGAPVKYWLSEAYSQIQNVYPQQREAAENWVIGDQSYFNPGYKFSAEEKVLKSRLLADLQTYEDEIVSKMIIGKEPVSKFDEYVENMKSLKIDEVINIYQTAHNRYMAISR